MDHKRRTPENLKARECFFQQINSKIVCRDLERNLEPDVIFKEGFLTKEQAEEVVVELSYAYALGKFIGKALLKEEIIKTLGLN